MTSSSTLQDSSKDYFPKMPTPSPSQLPYWNLNLPPHLHTSTCPPYLQNLSQKDFKHLQIPDALYNPLTFSQIRSIVSSNHLEAFTRLPSRLRGYREFVYKLKQQDGGVEKFVLEQRLGWDKKDLDDARRGGRKPFEMRSDYKILRNDWPYGVEEGVEHLVVWTKFSLGGEEKGGNTAREAIEEFMERTFYSHMARENVVWFRNWGDLKSVHAVEHIHVMVLNPDPRFIESIVEEPTSLKL